MIITRFVPVVLALGLWFSVGLSAQQPGQSSLRASLEREATRRALTLVAHDQSVGRAAGLHKAATQMGRANDWSAVLQLGDDRRVVVTTDLVPRWTPRNRPSIDTSKPATTHVASEAD